VAEAEETFDYVIVGAGSAGCVLANRLSEDGRYSVCVIEAGPPDRNPYIHIPAGFIKTLSNPRLTWDFPTEATPWTDGRSIPLRAGKTLGGSSSINGHVYNRGQRADFDIWAQKGNLGWSYVDLLPYFNRSEMRTGASGRGQEGALPVTDIDWHHPLCDAFVAGVAGLGLPLNPDYNSGRQEGVGFYQRLIKRGRRVSSARAFLKPIRARPNLTVRTDARVLRILVAQGRASGIVYAQGNDLAQTRSIGVRRELVLSSGTVNSPRLLQLSGIGPAPLLSELGIPIVQARPGVGENLQDHFAIRMVARVRGIDTINDRVRGPRLWREVAHWLLGQPSVLALNPSLAYVFAKSDPLLDDSDLQFTFTPASYREGSVGVLDDFPGVTCGVWQQRPESRGHVRLRSPSPSEAPIVQPNYLQHELDRRVLTAGIRLARRFLNTDQMSRYFDREELPGAPAQSDDELLDFARQSGSTVFHLTGTCRMGPATDSLAVVDPQLRLMGIGGLRIADASVMPNIPSANTNAATLMIAEKAAAMMIADRSVPSAIASVGCAAISDLSV
jgi:choline dehydrogenase